MNTPNNKRKRNSQERIERVFINLIQTKNINEISVSEIVKLAGVNRSTFYANYIDIFDLEEKIRDGMFLNMLELYKEESIMHKHSYDYLKLFRHIKDNQIYYKTLFKLNFDFTKYYDNHLEDEEALKYYGTTKNIDYHIAFFKAGINAILTKWIENDFHETPEEISEILRTEYQKNNIKIDL